MSGSPDAKWDWEIAAKTSWWGSSLSELWSYRHLLVGLVRRDFLLSYQQTVLGPLWMLFQPLMTLITYVLVFGKVVGISTQDTPPTLFYLAGIVLWNLFNDAFTNTSSTFRDNAHIFSKVYFPRLVMPLAQLSGQLLRFVIQLLLLLAVLCYYVLFTPWAVPVTTQLFLVPLAIALVAALSLSLGLIFSVLTGKYRDITYIAGLAIRLLMFLTPVIYPMSYVAEKWRWIVQINPLTPLFELFRLGLLGKGNVTSPQLFYSGAFTGVLLVVALLIFNKQGDKLIDVV
ncbi:ABC transporter permease [Hymenobacter terrenus]|uniref:ABC transporter permease n=1 Tax=Hymenobacter terrenus TaxID=1629124 RepID=UPI000619B1B8|nr:ABC transporter permease [Hymenobacter terrenus]